MSELLVALEVCGRGLRYFGYVWFHRHRHAARWCLNVCRGGVSGRILSEFDAGGLVEFIAVGNVGGHESGWRDKGFDVRGAGSVVDRKCFEGFVVGLYSVDGQLPHHGVVAGDHLEVGQVAEAVGFVDGADGLDGVIFGVVFETSEEIGCCDAAAGTTPIVTSLGMVSERLV